MGPYLFQTSLRLMLTAGNQKYKPMAWKERCNFGWHRKEWHIRNFLGREGKVSVGRVKYGAWGPALARSSGGMYVVGGAGGRNGARWERTYVCYGRFPSPLFPRTPFQEVLGYGRWPQQGPGVSGSRGRCMDRGRRMACRRRTDLPLAAMEISASER